MNAPGRAGVGVEGAGRVDLRLVPSPRLFLGIAALAGGEGVEGAVGYNIYICGMVFASERGGGDERNTNADCGVCDVAVRKGVSIVCKGVCFFGRHSFFPFMPKRFYYGVVIRRRGGQTRRGCVCLWRRRWGGGGRGEGRIYAAFGIGASTWDVPWPCS